MQAGADITYQSAPVWDQIAQVYAITKEILRMRQIQPQALAINHKPLSGRHSCLLVRCGDPPMYYGAMGPSRIGARLGGSRQQYKSTEISHGTTLTCP